VLFTIPVLISIFLLVGESQSPVISSIPAPYFCSARLGSGSCSPLADFYDFRWLIFPVSVLVPGVLLACLSVACWSATSSSLCSCAKLRPLNSLRAVRASAGQIRWCFGSGFFCPCQGSRSFSPRVDLFVSRPSCVSWRLFSLSRGQFPGPQRNAQLAPFVPAAAGPDSFAAAVQFVIRQLFLCRPVLASSFGVAVRELLSSSLRARSRFGSA
jgi:hypothetical protein